tara:strand:- start:828 stop:1049 length:222 start_codon:yes stop_codon:yes gene_type:complete
MSLITVIHEPILEFMLDHYSYSDEDDFKDRRQLAQAVLDGNSKALEAYDFYSRALEEYNKDFVTEHYDEKVLF